MKLLRTIRTIMQDEHVNLLTGDFNGAAWPHTSGNNLFRRVLLRRYLPTRTFRFLAPHHCGVLELFLVTGLTCAVSSYAQTHIIYGGYAHTGHSQFLEKSCVSDKETRASNISRKNHDHRVHFKEKSRPYAPTKERGRYDDGSDHSLSSLSSAREHMLP